MHLVADRRVRASLCHEVEDLPLAFRERADGPAPFDTVDERADDRGVEYGAAGGDLGEGVHELTRMGNPVLQQIADPTGLVGEEFAYVQLLDVLREQQDRQRGLDPSCR